MASAELRALAADARTTPTLVARGLTDPGSMRGIIWPAFRADVAPWAELDYEQEIVAPRLLEAVRAAPPAAHPGLAVVSNPGLFDRAGVLEPFQTPFVDLFPPGWADPSGRWVPLYVQPIVAIHNVHRALPPRGWTELAETSPDGRVVLDDPARMLTSGPALAELSTTLGETAWEALLRSLAGRAPLLVGDNERAVLEVSTGSRWVGLSNWNVARRVRPGSPVRYSYLSPTPCIPGFGVLLREAPSGPLARLFLAWLTSEPGQRAYAAAGRIPARPDVDGPLSLRGTLPAGVEPLFGTADWLTQPERWAERFRDLLPAGRETAREGKLR